MNVVVDLNLILALPHTTNILDVQKAARLAIANGEPDEGFEGYSDLKATYGRGSQLPTFIHHVTNMYQSSPMSL